MADKDVPLGDVAAEIMKPVKEHTGRKTATTDYSSDHAEALKRYEAGFKKDQKNQELAYEDLRFRVEEGQWLDTARRTREAAGRPILTVNKCPQFVRQVTGDIRQLRPAIKVVPVDDDADKDVATKILPGMIRYIEQRSDAKGAYFAAADQQVAAGIGHVRVYTEVANETTMEQEIGIEQVEDGICVVWDPDAIHPTRRDANFCFEPVDMSTAAFEERWPDASVEPLSEQAEIYNTWFSDDFIRVTRYWRKVDVTRKIAIYPTGEVVDLSDDEDGKKQADVDAFNATVDQMLLGGVQPGMLAEPPAKVKIEERNGVQVECFFMSAREFLEGPEKWPGAHIPVIPVIGEETKIGREIIRNGIIRALKDVQRLYNYAVSAEAEVVALQPKAPYKGTKTNFEEFEDEWEALNSENRPFLRYTPDPANGNRPPEREPPPVASSGIQNLLVTASGDFNAVSGIYPPSLGAASNETSGKAITARQREGDTGTFVYVENFGRMVQRVGEIVVDLIPHIYDTERTIRIVGEDGKIDMLPINKTVIDPNGDGIATKVLNDLTVGTYEVAVEMGPSYSTKREEARDGMATFMQAAGPQVAQLYIDLFAKMQDWPLADKIAKRAQLMLPQPIQQMEAKESGEPAPPPMPPPPPSPEQQMEMAKMQAEQQDKQQQRALDAEKIKAEFARIEADVAIANRAHEAAMAGHALALHQHQNPQGGDSDKVNALADAVSQLSSIVTDIASAIGLNGPAASNGGGNPPPPSGPVGGPPVSVPPAPGGPPPGAPLQ